MFCARPVNYTSTTVLPPSGQLLNVGNNLYKHFKHIKTLPQLLSLFPQNSDTDVTRGYLLAVDIHLCPLDGPSVGEQVAGHPSCAACMHGSRALERSAHSVLGKTKPLSPRRVQTVTSECTQLCWSWTLSSISGF